MDQPKLKRVAVVMGGTSHEAPVSMLSGEAVAAALREHGGYDVKPVVLETDSILSIPPCDAVYIALHGGYGEGGGIQADLDRAGLPYTGPGAAASRLAMDKVAAKRCLLKAGLPTPDYRIVTAADAETAPPLPLPLVVKPPSDGSSVGLFKVEKRKDWAAAVKAACALDSRGQALVETYIPGREWTVGIVGNRALPVVEIRAPGGWYDFSAKYKGGTQYLFPQVGPFTRKAQRLAKAAFRAVGCRGVSRVDFRVTEDNLFYILEINTVPGCTATSLLPKAAKQAGITFPRLCSRIVETAACDRPDEN